MALKLPERASYEYLKKLAKERLALLRVATPAAKLSDAQLAIAREYGFSSWRALKSELEARQAPYVAEFLRACSAGDVAAVRALLQREPALARARLAGGTTALHAAASRPEVVRLLIEQGADPNVRDTGDNATPLHFAAANGALESVRVLLDAGADVHGTGDLHNGDVIGWAARDGNQPVVDLLLERGARHHIFSAMALRDRALVEKLVEENADHLLRRRSRFENSQTPVHAAFAPPDGLGYLAGQPDYAMLELLLELGADVEAADDKGRTPLALALLRGDRRAAALLNAAGAKEPARAESAPGGPAREEIGALAKSVKRGSPMFSVRDMRATLRWYRAVGFAVHDEYEDAGELVFARLAFGNAEFTLTPGGNPGPSGVSMWFFTDRVETLYAAMTRRQLRAAGRTVDGEDDFDLRFDEDLYTPFYGGRQFSVRDLNGLSLIFWQPDWLAPADNSTAPA